MNLYKYLKSGRKYILFVCDFILWNISYYFAFAINRDSFLLHGFEYEFIFCLVILNICFPITCLLFKLYDKLWRYADIEDFFYVGIACLCSNIIFLASTISLSHVLKNKNINLGFRTYIITFLSSTFLMFMFRAVYRLSKILEKREFPHSARKRTLIVGAGEAATYALKEFSKNPENEYLPVCIVDDDREKIGRSVFGIKIIGSTSEIQDICRENNIDVILFTISSASKEDRKRILDVCSKTNLEVKIIPNICDIVSSNASITSTIRRVNVEDLLGREPVVLDIEAYGKYIIDKTILVTGGGGSIGSELCRQIAHMQPKNLIIFDIYENNAYDIQQELKRAFGNKLNFEVQIGSVRDKNKLESLFKEKGIDVVFHAAAHKHVPLMETNPEEAVKNNIFGTLNLAQIASEYKAKKFVQISTDKAVNPTSIMGATKRICEMIIQMMDEISSTEFVAVRFGNVLGSNGSVIPLFETQIKEGGPITVTHPDIIRFFMTIPEAVSLVLTAGSIAHGGEIFILDMGEPVKIKDLAENLIRLSGLIPGKDIEIKYTGLRPGEKLYEEILLNEEKIQKTKNKKIYIGQPIQFDKKLFKKNLKELSYASASNNSSEIEHIISKMVPTFNHSLNKNNNLN